MNLHRRFSIKLLAATVSIMFLVVLLVYRQVSLEVERDAYATCYKILAYVEASRTYVREQLRPRMVELVGIHNFIPEAMSGSFVARELFENFLTVYPDYVIKFASVTPRNLVNIASDSERRVIEKFANDLDLTEWQGVITNNDMKYVTVAKPFRFKKACLRCHSTPQNAPPDLVSLYGDKNGFDMKVGDVTMYSIGVPYNVTFTNIWNKSVPYVFLISIFSIFTFVFSSKLFKNLTKSLVESEKDLKNTAQHLKKRVKELDCLYGISKLTERKDITIDRLLQGVTKLLPLAWRYPEITCIQITIGNQIYKTDNFKETSWRQSQDISVYGKYFGMIDVYYLEETKGIDDEPFIAEERKLINAVSERLGHFFEKMQTETEKDNLEIQLRQAHKMEALGTLSGGIAHDFNNLLAAILGYADMAKDELSDSHPAKSDIEQVLIAGNRAKDIVKQILFFSRKQIPELIPVQLDVIVNEALVLLRATIPTTIEIRRNITPACGSVLADPNQIHQILMNLCTNAAHAMDEDGGVLNVSLNMCISGKNTITGVGEGREYIRITVEDNGPGINDQLLENIFDPYFTTKDVGKGSGMGLAVVAGIVKSHDGEITVDSKLGEGATFTVYFPKVDERLTS